MRKLHYKCVLISFSQLYCNYDAAISMAKTGKCHSTFNSKFLLINFNARVQEQTCMRKRTTIRSICDGRNDTYFCVCDTWTSQRWLTHTDWYWHRPGQARHTSTRHAFVFYYYPHRQHTFMLWISVISLPSLSSFAMRQPANQPTTSPSPACPPDPLPFRLSPAVPNVCRYTRICGIDIMKTGLTYLYQHSTCAFVIFNYIFQVDL